MSTMTTPRNLTITQASNLIEKKLLSPVDLVSDLLQVTQQHEYMLHVWSYIDPSLALAKARNCEKEIVSGSYRGPMHGIPIGVKDIYFTKDMKTTCGSPIYESFYSDYDAKTISALRSSGAIVMGKTVTTQFASGDPPITKNPWNLDRTPGGSSSGSAVGVSARFFPAALGSQTAGSVLRPAAYNGIVGFKPTYGVINESGIHPVAPSLDTVGWFTRCVNDSDLLLQSLIEFGSNTENIFQSNEQASIIRLGLVSTYYPDVVDTESGAEFRSLITSLETDDKHLKISNFEFEFDEILTAHAIVMSSEAAHTHERNFSIRPQDYAEKIKQLIQTGLQTNAVDYLNAKKMQKKVKARISDALCNYDALITPTAISGAPYKDTTGQPEFQAPWTFTGNPTISIPYKLDSNGLPLGLQIIGKHNEDLKLLKIAEHIESLISFEAQPL